MYRVILSRSIAASIIYCHHIFRTLTLISSNKIVYKSVDRSWDKLLNVSELYVFGTFFVSLCGGSILRTYFELTALDFLITSYLKLYNIHGLLRYIDHFHRCLILNKLYFTTRYCFLFSLKLSSLFTHSLLIKLYVVLQI